MAASWELSPKTFKRHGIRLEFLALYHEETKMLDDNDWDIIFEMVIDHPYKYSWWEAIDTVKAWKNIIIPIEV